MINFFKMLAEYFKAIGWKKYLLYLLITILCVVGALGLLYAGSLLFRVSIWAGILGIVGALAIIFVIQYLIVKRTEKKHNKTV